MRQFTPKSQKSEDEVKSLITQFERTKSERSNFEKLWQDVAEVTYPDAATFSSPPSPGEKRTNKIVESTAVVSNQLLAAGIYSLLTNPTVPWFAFRTSDPALDQQYDVSLYLELCTNIALHEIQRPEAGFTTAAHEAYLDLGAFGNMAPFLTEDIANQRLQFTTFPLRECFVMEDYDGRPNQLFRSYTRTAQQIVDKYGEDACPQEVREAATNGKNTSYDILHVLRYRPTAVVSGLFSNKLPVESIHILTKHRTVLKESGFHEMPHFFTRFFKAAGETYGRGPGMWALPDTLMLQEIKKTTLRGAQLRINPALQAPDDGFLTPIRLSPGGLNFYRSGSPDRIEPIQAGGDTGLGLDIIEDTRRLVREAFYIDQMQLGFGPQMTATEVMQRTEEKLRMMGPLVGRVQTEFLGPMIQRAFGCLLRMGKFPPPPASMLERKAKLRIVYTSALARAQEQVQANGFLRLMELIAPLLQAKQEAWDNLQTDNIIRGIGDMFSISKKFFTEQEEMIAVRQERAQAIQQQQQAELLQTSGLGIESLARSGVALKDAGLPIDGMMQ